MARISPSSVHRGLDVVVLVARVVGGDQMLAPVLDPFHRALQPHRRDADQDVLGIELAADAEAAADVRLVALHRRRRAVEHARDQLLVAVRHFGGAVQFQHVARGVVAAERAARLQRHAGVPAAGELQLDDVRRGFEHRFDVAVALRQDRGFGVAAEREFAGLVAGVEQRRQFLDLHGDEIGGVLGDVGVLGEHRRHRLADIAHLVRRQHRLAVGRELLDRPFAEIDRRHVGDVGRGPHRDHARQRARGVGVDRDDVGVGVVGAHDPHVKLAREVDVAGKAAAAGDQRRVLQPLDRLADPFRRAALRRSCASRACSSARQTMARTMPRR